MTEIELIQHLREEMNQGFRDVRDDISDLSTGMAAHIAVHGERDKVQSEAGVTRRWVITTTLAIVSVVVTAALGITGIIIRIATSVPVAH